MTKHPVEYYSAIRSNDGAVRQETNDEIKGLNNTTSQGDVMDTHREPPPTAAHMSSGTQGHFPGQTMSGHTVSLNQVSKDRYHTNYLLRPWQNQVRN